MKKHYVKLIMLLIFLAVYAIAISFAVYIYIMAPTYTYDFNFELFQRLTQQEKNSIYHIIQTSVKMSSFPLIITNAIAFVMAGYFLFALKRNSKNADRVETERVE